MSVFTQRIIYYLVIWVLAHVFLLICVEQTTLCHSLFNFARTIFIWNIAKIKVVNLSQEVVMRLLCCSSYYSL